MTAAVSTRKYTAEEYLALEVESEVRHEFRDGEIVEMTGGTPEHNEISSDFLLLLKVALRRKPYSVFITDQRLWIPAANKHTYPDVMLTPRPPALKPGRKDTVMDPILIAEVLSDSTEAYDRTQKFAHYRTIETFQEYLLIDQHRPHVEHYIKQAENRWLFAEYSGLDASFTLSTVEVEIEIADLYESIDFEAVKVDPDASNGN